MQTRALWSLLGALSLVASSGCGGSAECGPGTRLEGDTCVVDGAGGGGGGGNVDDLGDRDPGLGGDDDPNPGDPGPGEDPGPGDMPGDPGDPGADPGNPGADPGNPGDPGDPGPGPGGGDPGAGCDGADCSALSHQILDAINAARAAAGEGACAGGAFAWDDGVAGVALGHAQAMAAAGQLQVDDPGGTLGNRLDAAGIGYSSVGEVYGRAYGSPAEVVEMWMGSEQLRPYLVSCEYTLGGVGAAPPAAGGPAYLTGTFVAP